MKKAVLVTQMEFWIKGRGSLSRVRELIRYLASSSNLTILCLAEAGYDLDSAKREFPDINIVGMYRIANDMTESMSQVRAFLHAEAFDVAIIEYLVLHWVVDLLPKETVSILDSHDILSLRASSFRKHNRKAYYEISEEQEFSLFQKFNRIMFIQEEECELGKKILVHGTALLCPHPVTCMPVVSHVENVVGFIGSTSQANSDALIWLNDEIAPLVKHPDAVFAVFGMVVHNRNLVQRCHRLKFIGPVSELDEFYSRITVAVNPVIYGGGLKIKCVEALAYGVPLVTTRVGAQGLMKQAEECFLMASTAEDFALKIDMLLGSAEQRQRLVRNSIRFMRENMSPEACFRKLLD